MSMDSSGIRLLVIVLISPLYFSQVLFLLGVFRKAKMAKEKHHAPRATNTQENPPYAPGMRKNRYEQGLDIWVNQIGLFPCTTEIGGSIDRMGGAGD